MSKYLRVSWTRLSTWEECRQKAFRHSQGKRLPADGRVFLPGTLADRSMRKWLEEDDPRPGGMLRYVDSQMEEHTGPDAQYQIKWKGDPVEDRRRVRETVVEGLEKLEPLLYELVLPHDYSPEFRFEAPVFIPGLVDDQPVPIILIGGMDILVRRGADWTVYDLKLTRNDDYVRGRTLGQLTFYSLAVRALFETHASSAAFLTPLCKERVVEAVVGEEERRVMMSRIIKYAHGVWRQEHEPNGRDSSCRVCDVKHACSKYDRPMIEDVKGLRRMSLGGSALRSL